MHWKKNTVISHLTAAAGIAFGLSYILFQTRSHIEPEKKNVLVILVDTLRADHLSAYGYFRPTTPNLNRFASKSFVFENARSQAACTFPSVNSLLTSQYPMLFLMKAAPYLKTRESTDERVYELWQKPRAPAKFGIPDNVPSLPQILKQHGYSTIAVSSSTIVRNKPSEEATNHWGGFGKGFDIFHEECLRKDARCVNNAAFNQLVSRAKDPFFLYLHYFDPHEPYSPPLGFKTKFESTYRGTKDFIAKGNLYPIRAALLSDPAARFDIADLRAEDIRHLEALYDSEIAYFDYQFGKLIYLLKERNLLEKTLIILMSDHGESFMEHQNIGHCNGVYEEEIHVPLMIYVPDAHSPARIREPVENLDVVPTILDYLGFPATGLNLQGKSLLPLCQERHGPSKERYAFSAQRRQRSISDPQHKLVYDILADRFQLYDLAIDRDETKNIYGNDPFSTKMRARLLTFLELTEGKPRAEVVQVEDEIEEQLHALGYFQ